MNKSLNVKVRPEVLKTIRESSGYTIEEIAEKVKTTTKKVEETEKDAASFTLTGSPSFLVGKI